MTPWTLLRENHPRAGIVDVVVADDAVTVTCARPGLLIGKRGAMLKEIGQRAREELEKILGCRIFLELFIRVDPDWTQNPNSLVEMGL